MRLLLIFTLLLLLVSCDRESMLKKFSSPEDQAAARAYIEQLRAREFGEIEKAMDATVKTPTLHATLEQMAGLIPPGEPSSVKVVGAQTMKTPTATSVNTTFEFDFGGTWLLINVAVKTAGAATTIVGFQVRPEAQPLEVQNRFSLTGKAPIQYIILGAAVLGALLSLYALIVCVRTKVPGRKWPWVLFIIFGVGKASVNWTTGQWAVQLIAVQLFSAAAISALYGPWVISAAVPVGAVAFLAYRRMRLSPSPIAGAAA